MLWKVNKSKDANLRKNCASKEPFVASISRRKKLILCRGKRNKTFVAYFLLTDWQNEQTEVLFRKKSPNPKDIFLWHDLVPWITNPWIYSFLPCETSRWRLRPLNISFLSISYLLQDLTMLTWWEKSEEHVSLVYIIESQSSFYTAHLNRSHLTPISCSWCFKKFPHKSLMLNF